jgi:hypothetical protein
MAISVLTQTIRASPETGSEPPERSPGRLPKTKPRIVCAAADLCGQRSDAGIQLRRAGLTTETVAGTGPAAYSTRRSNPLVLTHVFIGVFLRPPGEHRRCQSPLLRHPAGGQNRSLMATLATLAALTTLTLSPSLSTVARSASAIARKERQSCTGQQGRQDRRGAVPATDPGRISCDPSSRDRAPVQFGNVQPIRSGIYSCLCCKTILFDASEKFESGTGWPSCTQPVAINVIAYRFDGPAFLERVENRLQNVRRSSGASLSPWPRPEWAALLHECRRPQKASEK